MVPKTLLLLLCVNSLFSKVHGDSVRDGNGGNCVNVTSCRPRCVTFRLDRTKTDCDKAEGAFAEQTEPNPWDIQEFRTFNCESAGTCFNSKCGQDLPGNVTLRISEDGDLGSPFVTNVELKDNQERFTFCSVYPCPNEECALPEQMGSELRLEIHEGSSGQPSDEYLLALELSLTASFAGSAFHEAVDNRYGPLYLEWMDDPTGCRHGAFPDYAPIAPPAEPLVDTNLTEVEAGLYCEGDTYDLSPLPQAMTPSAAPSLSPTTTATWTPEELNQIEALQAFYNSTNMGHHQSKRFHNWFTVDNYCDFTGIVCDANGFVTSIDLTNKRLSGILPTSSWELLSKLQTLKLVGNLIEGSIPSQLAQLSHLTHLELAVNNFSGPIPESLSSLNQIRRLMLQYNKLNGTIPESVCDLTKLLAFDISGNKAMHGEIPSCFGTLPLEVLRVEDVGLVGEVPPALCAVRNINGLAPNRYGCEGIACPAGSYEPILGRKSNGNSQCLTCVSPSNVIGSTKCVLLEGNDIVTQAPSSSPAPSGVPSFSASPTMSFSPSAVPSASPIPTASIMPTVGSSNAPSGVETVSSAPSASKEGYSSNPSAAPSLHPSSPPSSVPTIISTAPLTPAPSQANTPSPTKANSTKFHEVSVNLILLFADIPTKLTDSTDKAAFNHATKTFLNRQLPVQVHVVHDVLIVSQFLHEPESESDGIVHLSFRHLSQAALHVKIRVQGETIDTDKAFKMAIEQSLKDQYGSYIYDLSKDIDSFATPVGSKGGGKDNMNWALLVVAVVLSVVAVATLLVVRQLHRRDRLSASDGQNSGAHWSKKEKKRRFFSFGGKGKARPPVEGGSLSDESSAGWRSGEGSEEGEFVNPVRDNESIESDQEWTVDPLDHMTEYDGDNMSRTPSTTEQSIAVV